MHGFQIDLTPKGPLSPRGTKWILGRYLRSPILVKLSKTFPQVRKSDKLCEYIIFISIGAHMQKLYHKKPKIWFGGQHPGSTKKSQKVKKKKFNFFSLNNMFVHTCEALARSIWNNNEKVMANLIFRAI